MRVNHAWMPTLLISTGWGSAIVSSARGIRTLGTHCCIASSPIRELVLIIWVAVVVHVLWPVLSDKVSIVAAWGDITVVVPPLRASGGVVERAEVGTSIVAVHVLLLLLLLQLHTTPLWRGAGVW